MSTDHGPQSIEDANTSGVPGQRAAETANDMGVYGDELQGNATIGYSGDPVMGQEDAVNGALCSPTLPGSAPSGAPRPPNPLPRRRLLVELLLLNCHVCPPPARAPSPHKTPRRKQRLYRSCCPTNTFI